MSENKQNSKVEQAKQKAGALYEKGNELMDKVSFLKNPRNKKIAWGVLGAICLLVVFVIVGALCGGGQKPFDVFKETMIAAVQGDLETMFEHMYIPAEEREKLSKLSEKEAELVEKEIVEEFLRQFEGLSEEQLAIIQEGMKNMKEVETKTDGDKATVTASVMRMGEERRASVQLRKEDGEWKVLAETIKEAKNETPKEGADQDSKEAPQKQECLLNMRKLRGAVEQWQLEDNSNAGKTPTLDDLCGPDKFFERVPICPAGGKYAIKVSDGTVEVTCSISEHVLK